MKKSKLILIICACMCVVLSGIVLAIAFWQPPAHKHKLLNAKTYHIYNDRVYYTRQCKDVDGYIETVNMNATFVDVLSSIQPEDKIILEENIVVNKEITLNSFRTDTPSPEGINLVVNLDLNDKTISTNGVFTKTNNSLFMLNATYGQLEFNVKNGSISSQELLYIFKFTAREGNIKLNIDDVEFSVEGIKATPLYVHDVSSVTVNANDSKFIARNTTSVASESSVGVFINSDGTFNFDNCYFQGGDAVHVRRGTVNLTDCVLNTKGLLMQTEQTIVSGDGFMAMGASLVADSRTDANGTSVFKITVTGCTMTTENSNRMIYVLKTATQGSTAQIEAESIVDVVSCIFTRDPANGGANYNIVEYPNDEMPVSNGNNQWVCGNIES